MLDISLPEKIQIDAADIPERYRAMNEDRVTDLMASMAEIGLMSPIHVRSVDDGRFLYLVAGRHRLEAARRLGWQEIDACFLDGDDDEFRLWEIAENLHRSELTPLERSEHIAEWVRLMDKKLAQLEPVFHKGGRGKEGGIRAVTREIGIDRNEAQRASKIDSIAPEAKQAARDVGIDTNQSALLKVAAAPKDEQVEVAMALGAARSSRRKADDDEEAVAAFLAFATENLTGSAIGELADRLEAGPVKKFVVALRGLV